MPHPSYSHKVYALSYVRYYCLVPSFEGSKVVTSSSLAITPPLNKKMAQSQLSQDEPDQGHTEKSVMKVGLSILHPSDIPLYCAFLVLNL